MKYLGPISDPKDIVNKEYVDNNSGGDHIELTQSEYDALSQAEKENGTVYFVTDGEPSYTVINDSVPIGAIQSYGGSTAPSGWLICDGSAVSRATYSELFAVIGTTYGSGDGSTTFNIPDMRGRFPLGAGALQSNNQNYWGSDVTSLSGQSCFFPIGERGGETKHTLTISQMPQHRHGINYVGSSGSGYGYQDTGSGRSSGYQYTTNEGGDGAHNNLPPYTVANAIIKAKDHTLLQANLMSMLDMFYPVGCYMETSDSSYDPNVSLGGIWVESSATLTEDISYEVVTATIGQSRSSNVAITAPTKSGYTFVHWSHVSTNGWIGSCYVENPQNVSSTIWNSYSGGATSGTGMVRVLAIYKKNKTITRWHRTA